MILPGLPLDRRKPDATYLMYTLRWKLASPGMHFVDLDVLFLHARPKVPSTVTPQEQNALKAKASQAGPGQRIDGCKQG